MFLGLGSGTALCAFAAPLAHMVAQDAAADDELPPVSAPPELRGHIEQKLARSIKSLRNSNPEARAKYEKQVIGYGRAALPLLIEACSTDHEGKQAGLLLCLETLVELQDRELVAAQVASEHALLRRFAARTAGRWLWPPLIEALPPLLDDPAPEVREDAALSLLAAGNNAGLAVLLLQATEPTGRDVTEEQVTRAAALKARVLQVLPGLAERGDHRLLRDALIFDAGLHRDDPAGHAATRRTAVQMLAAVGDHAAIVAIHGALDDSHNLVQRDAIDALRRLLEGKGAFEGGSIFAQINEVKRLKELGTARR
ncbi:MAG: hypothetical protein DHS20C15_06970 [Planctomycetota bacterium]|nr:MAG: hypothetical protein DHS20C15_06970 [Planctomycetota bacterium]